MFNQPPQSVAAQARSGKLKKNLANKSPQKLGQLQGKFQAAAQARLQGSKSAGSIAKGALGAARPGVQAGETAGNSGNLPPGLNKVPGVKPIQPVLKKK